MAFEWVPSQGSESAANFVVGASLEGSAANVFSAWAFHEGPQNTHAYENTQEVSFCTCNSISMKAEKNHQKMSFFP